LNNYIFAHFFPHSNLVKRIFWKIPTLHPREALVKFKLTDSKQIIQN